MTVVPMKKQDTVHSLLDWNKSRWDWVDLVMADGCLPMRSKALASVLIRSFANHKSGRCFPGIEKLRLALGGVSEDTIERSLSDLSKAGYLRRQRAQGDRRRREIEFLWPDAQRQNEFAGEHELPRISAGNAPPKKTVVLREIPRSSAVSPKPPYKEQPIYEPKRERTTVHSNSIGGNSDLLEMFAEKIRAGKYVASSAVSPSQARTMVDRKLVSVEQLREKGITI